MKKFLIALLLLSVLPVTTKAEIADIDPLGETVSSCIDLSSNMRYRMRDRNTNEGVSILQDFLNAEGFLNVAPTGYFGTATLKAVKSFQSSFGISPTGFVGPLTRAKIKATTCGGTGGTTATTGSTTTTITTTPTATTVPGCTSTMGYSSTTGRKCDSTTTVVAPEITITANNVSDTLDIIENTSVTFSWNASNANSCSSSDGMSNWATSYKPTSGSVELKDPITVSRTYTITCRNSSGMSVSRSVRVNVKEATTNLPAGCTSTAGYSSVTGNSCSGSTVATPYISSISYYPASAEPSILLVTGNNFTQGTMLHYRDLNNLSVSGSLDMVGGMSSTRITFAADVYMVNNVSKYAITVLDAQGKKSNEVHVSTATNTQPSITVLSPNGGEVLTAGEKYSIQWTTTVDAIGTQIRIELYDTSINNNDNPVSLIANNVPVSNSSYTWSVPSTVSSKSTYKIVISKVGESGEYDRSNAPFSIATATTDTITTAVPTVEVIGTPTLSLQYDSARKESALVANYSVSVTAPVGVNFKLYKYGAFDNDTYAFLVKLNDAKGANGASTNGNYSKVSGNATDNGTYWTISAGQTATFSLTANLSHPKTLFAGSYNATLSIYKPAGGAGVAVVAVKGSSTTNSVTIIGETAPYIQSSYQPTSSSGAYLDDFVVIGVRFSPTSNQVTMNGVTKLLPTGASDKGPLINIKISDFGIMTTGVYQLQISTNEGASNMVNVNVNIGAPAAVLTVESIGTPTLRLEYNFASKESALVANYTVKITAGIQPLSFPSYSVNCGGGTPVSFSVLNSSRQVAPVTSCATGPATIPSGTSATYQIKLTANPNQIFSGSYTATLEPGISSLDLSTGQWMTTPLPTPVLIGSLKTNTVTVVGERAPYLTSVVNDATSNVNITITGTRFHPTSNIVQIGGVSKTLASYNNGTTINTSMKDFGLTSAGVYAVQVTHSTEGASNVFNVNVTVTPTTTTQPSITVTSPNGGEAWEIGNSYTIEWNQQNVDSVTIFLMRTSSLHGPTIASSYSVPITASTGSYTYTVPSNITLANTYKIWILGYKTGYGQANDWSDAPFGIVPVALGTAQSSSQLAGVLGAFSQPLTSQTTPTPAPQWTYEWTRNLEVGSSYADDIIALQSALTKEGVYSVETSGGFYTQTYLAVKAFQEKYGIESTGFVGPLTRARLNELY